MQENLFAKNPLKYEKLRNGGAAVKINNCTIGGGGGWFGTVYSGTRDSIIIGVMYYFRVIASPAAWDFGIGIVQKGSGIDISLMTESTTFTSGMQTVYFTKPIYMSRGDIVNMYMNYAGSMTLNWWGNVIVAESV